MFTILFHLGSFQELSRKKPFDPSTSYKRLMLERPKCNLKLEAHTRRAVLFFVPTAVNHTKKDKKRE